MKAAWNKLTQKAEKECTTPKPQALPPNLQKKYSKGVQYNMKVIIKGDHNVGKTCLFERLQGLPYTGEYQETAVIQIAAIQWNYKNTDDVVKVEIWDVVDKAKKRILQDKLKTENSEERETGVALDAEFIDVYKGTNGVILVFDITKKWTYDYVQKEMAKIPGNIPVLILGNRCDQAHHRAVGSEEPKYYVENLNRASSTRYAEASMYNSFGLKFLYKWFNLPFLQLQRETLLKQLETNERETNVTVYELDVYEQTEESNYDLFLEKLNAQRRSKAEQNSNIPPSASYVPSPPHGVAAPLPNSISNRHLSVIEPMGKGKPIIPVTSATTVVDGPLKPSLSSISSLGTELKLTSVVSVEDFVPDDVENMSKMFLDDIHLGGENGTPTAVPVEHGDDSDSDADNQVNPLVAGFQDGVEQQDYVLHPNNSHFANQNHEESIVHSHSPNLSILEDMESTPMKQGSKKKKKKEKKRKKSENKDDELEEFLNNF